MIDPAQLHRKALKAWRDGSFLRAWMQGETLFPLEIRFGKPSAKSLGENFRQVQAWITTLKGNSKSYKGCGYSVSFKPIQHRLLGKQQVPQRIWFESEKDWLPFIDKEAEFGAFQKLEAMTRRQLPGLLAFLAADPIKVLELERDWPRLLAVSAWLQENPRPGCYVRQLEIPGVDTKFIGAHKKVLTSLLDLILPPPAVDRTATGLAQNGFERRYGFKYDQPLIRFRILDDNLAINGLTDLSLPLDQMAGLEWEFDTVFITENKVNGLSFPEVAGALVIFGLGYGVDMLAELLWLRGCKLVYWGDIDTHGFAILSRLRGYFPHVDSLLMDRQTLMDHRHLWVAETRTKRFSGDLHNLTAAEQVVFKALKENLWGERIRLEQERIGYRRLLDLL